MTTPAPAPGVPEGVDLTDEQKAFLLAQQAQQAATSPSPAAQQAAAAAQMAGAERGPELPAESEMDKMMALIKAQSDQLASLTAQVGVMQKQAEEAVAQQGGPPIIRLAQAVSDKVDALRVAHPDLGPDHFAVPVAAAGQLVDAATTLSKQGGSADPVKSAVADLERWFAKTHWRTGRKFIDFSAVTDDLERAHDEAAKIAA